jgi:hypothetical protein
MTTQELEVRAKVNKEQIHEAIYNVRANFLVLGKLLKENRDVGLWKLEYDSFEALLGDPGIGLKRSTAYGLIQIVELYLDKLGVPADRVLAIGNSKLLAIASVVEADKEGWLSQAEALSKSDLKIQIAEAGGKTLSPPTLSPRPSSPMTCINECGPGEKSHFPVGRGGSAEDDWWVPMCRKCHTEYHLEPKDWSWKYRRNWAKYLYGLVNRGE